MITVTSKPIMRIPCKKKVDHVITLSEVSTAVNNALTQTIKHDAPVIPIEHTHPEDEQKNNNDSAETVHQHIKSKLTVDNSDIIIDQLKTICHSYLVQYNSIIKTFK